LRLLGELMNSNRDVERTVKKENSANGRGSVTKSIGSPTAILSPGLTGSNKEKANKLVNPKKVRRTASGRKTTRERNEMKVQRESPFVGPGGSGEAGEEPKWNAQNSPTA